MRSFPVLEAIVDVGSLPLCVLSALNSFLAQHAECCDDVVELKEQQIKFEMATIKCLTYHRGSVKSFDNIFSEVAGPILLVGVSEQLVSVVLEMCLRDCIIANRLVILVSFLDVLKPIHQSQQESFLIWLLHSLNPELQRVHSRPISNCE